MVNDIKVMLRGLVVVGDDLMSRIVDVDCFVVFDGVGNLGVV